MTDTQMTYKEWADLLPHTIFEINNSGTIAFANEEAFNTFGYTRDDLDRGLQALDMFVPEDRDKVKDSIRRTLNGEKLGAVEFTVLRQDGTHFPALVYGAPIFKEGQPVGLTGSVVDISARKQAEEELRESEEKLRTIFDNVKDQIAYVDEYGTIIDVNSRVENIFGYKPEEVIGKNFAEVAFIDHEAMQRMASAFDKAISSGTSNLFEFEAIRKDGNPVFLEASTNLIRFDSGENRSLVIIRDITERKRTEKTLYRIQKAVESSNEAIGMSDSQGNHFYQNKAFTEMFGYTAEELATKGGGPVVYADPDVARDVFTTIMAGDSWAGEIEMISKNGDKFPVSLSADAVKDDNGEIIGLIGIHTDITERKKAEQALRDSEEKFRAVFENANDEIILVNIDGTIVDVNKDIVSGSSRDELIGKNIAELDMFKPDQLAEINKLFYEAIHEGKLLDIIELEGVDENGNAINLEVSTNIIMEEGEIQGFVAIVSDITERKRIEQALIEQHNAVQTYAHELEMVNEELRSTQTKLIESNQELQESEKKYRDLADLLPQTVFEADLEGNCTYANRHALETFGFTQEDLDKGLNALELFTDTDRKRAEQNIERKLRQEEFQEEEYTAVRKDGSTMPVLLYTDLIIHNNEPTGIRGIVLDITERKKTEEALQANEERFRMLIENSSDGIILLDREGIISYQSPSCERLSGYTSDKAVGMPPAEFIHPDDVSDVYRVMGALIDSTEKTARMEIRFLYKDGSWCWVEAVATNLLDDPRINGIITNFRDITERKQAEAQLQDSEAQYRSIAETVIEGIYQVDAFGSYVFVNEAYARIMGYETEELLGKHYHMVIPKESIEAATKITEAARSGKIQEGEFVLKHKLGHGVPAHFSMGAWERQGHQNGFIGTIHDITERKQAEEELTKYRDHLEGLVAERTVQLTQMNEDLQIEIEQRKQAKEALQRSEEYFRHLIENSSDMIVVLDAEVNIRYASPSIKHVSGHEPGELIGQSGFDFVHPDEINGAVELFATAIESPGFSFVIVIRLHRKDGAWRYVELTGKNLIADPAINGVVLNFHDIDDRMRAEEAMRESEEKFRTIFEEATDGITFLDEFGKILDINKRQVNAWGYNREGIVGRNFMEFGFVLPEYLDDIVAMFTEMITNETPVVTEVKATRKDGSIIFFELSAGVMYLGSQKAIVAITRDITERKQAEEALRKSEERFRALIENAAEGIAVLNSDGTIQYISPSSKRVLGYDASEALGIAIFESIHPEDQQRISENLTDLLQGPGSMITSTYRALHKDGTWHVMEVIGENLMENQNIRGVIVNFRDITERTQAEEALRESEEKFRTIFENVTEEIVFVDESGTILDVNNKIEDIWGYKPEEVIGKKFTEFGLALPDSIQDLIPLIDYAFSGGEPVIFEVEAQRKDGSTLLAELSGRVIQVGGRKAALAIVRDITERKRAEEALRASEERFRSIIEDAHDAFTLINAEGIVQYDSPSVERITGYRQGELLDMSIDELVHPEDLPTVTRNIARILATPGAAENIAMRFRVADGSWRWIEGTGKNFLDDPYVQAIVCNYRDVTERMRDEEQLHQYATELQQANSELSEYSQVVVHDIGTPLRAIRYHTRILRGLSKDIYTDDQKACLNTIDDAVFECEELAQSLLGLSQLGRSELRVESVDTDALLQKVIASSVISSDVDIVMGKKWPTINSDPVLLGHIFRNLIDNAIKFSDAPNKRVEIKWKTSGMGKYEFSVSDNGIGIDPKNQEVIFQVFKRLHHQDKYKGTGIGLAIVKKSTSLLGGSIRVESKLGEGSTFVVTIPKSQKKRRK
ncbi:MAG: PAS domain S-box protein [Chloroflexi bacterium]|nr:PAS domain S-box protein [Chloroflexota bacterium]